MLLTKLETFHSLYLMATDPHTFKVIIHNSTEKTEQSSLLC